MEDNSFFSIPFNIYSEYCGRDRLLRTSSLLAKCQTIAGLNMDALGYSSPEMLKRGLLWIILRMNVEVNRLPEYGENCTLVTWYGKIRFSLFPRFYELRSESGETLVRISSTWGIMNAKTRSFATQEEHGITNLPITETGTELPQKVKFPKNVFDDETGIHTEEITVPYSYLDVNGHMNNTRYFELADNLLPSPRDGKTLKQLHIEYCNEIKPDSTFTVRWKEIEPSVYYMEGSTDKICYKLILKY